MTRLAVLIATWFGCGYSPVAPGTAGSLAALGDRLCSGRTCRLDVLAFRCAGAALRWPVASGRPALPRALSQTKDPGIVVVDEVLGQWITLAGASSLNWKTLAGCILPVPAVRYLEAAAGAATGSAARRDWNRGRRRDGRHLCGTCLIYGGMFQSLLNMATAEGFERAARDRAGLAGGGYRRGRVADSREGIHQAGSAPRHDRRSDRAR